MKTMTRREAIKSTVVGTAACAVALSDLNVFQAAAQDATPFKLPPLPYAFDALEPHIDARTMEIHHDKHHAGYVRNLNKIVAANTSLQGRSVDDLLANLKDIPDDLQNGVRNHGGGHYNHSLFWQTMKKGGGGKPTPKLAAAIDNKFGSFDAFKEQFSEAAVTWFGSGWAWLSVHEDHLHLGATSNQDSPLSAGHTPLLGVDVWEHAYYLHYQNRRADYVNAWFNVINWEFVSDRFDKFTEG